MNVTREQISVALFQLLHGNQALSQLCTTITRSPKIWTEATTAEMPWLQLFKGGPDTETFTQNQAIGLTKYQINFHLWLYLTADPTGATVVETTINNIADAIDAAMQNGMKGERQTLGGLVNNAWLNNTSDWGREFDDDNIVIFWRITVETGI